MSDSDSEASVQLLEDVEEKKIPSDIDSDNDSDDESVHPDASEDEEAPLRIPRDPEAQWAIATEITVAEADALVKETRSLQWFVFLSGRWIVFHRVDFAAVGWKTLRTLKKVKGEQCIPHIYACRQPGLSLYLSSVLVSLLLRSELQAALRDCKSVSR
ncbi:MAG TPA: hypothetical protein V6C97_02550 [Oculatellaceae cyanobacterium]